MLRYFQKKKKYGCEGKLRGYDLKDKRHKRELASYLKNRKQSTKHSYRIYSKQLKYIELLISHRNTMRRYYSYFIAVETEEQSS
jgi:hypothetical protein